MLLAQTRPLVRIKQVETAFVISVDVVALWITINFASFVHFSDSWNASALSHNKRGSILHPFPPTKKKKPKTNLFGKCCFNLASFPVSCLYPVSFHMFMFLCWWATCPLPFHSRICMYGSAKPPVLRLARFGVGFAAQSQYSGCISQMPHKVHAWCHTHPGIFPGLTDHLSFICCSAQWEVVLNFLLLIF